MSQSSKQTTYVVAIPVDGIEYTDVYHCSNLDEAVQMAIAEHIGKTSPFHWALRVLWEASVPMPAATAERFV
jgi:hypothetical protein